jgi:putative aldouronate transport system substrate-binding protein
LTLAFSACNNSSGSSGSGATGTAVTTQVSGIKLTVTPQAGEAKYYPQPATSYTTNPDYPQEPAVSNRGGFPITQQKTDVKLAVPYYSYVMDYENNDLTKYMEELTNVHIVWDLLPEVNAMERINLLFAAGDVLPDAFMGAGFPTTMLATLGPAGLIIPLQDIIDRNSFVIKDLYDLHPEHRATSISFDGNQYAMGNYSIQNPNMTAMRFWINTTFLKNLNMTMPTTTEEYYQYLKAVKTRDPNRNGKADEIPLVGATEGWHAEIDGFLMNAFAYNETSTDRNPINRRCVYLSADGKIQVSFNTPEWRQGLEYMNKLYSEGLLAGESFTLHKEGLRSLVENQDALIVGSLPNGGPHEFANTGGDRRTHFQVVPPLKGPNGRQSAWYDEYSISGTGGLVITKDSKLPDVIIKWVDYAHTEDFTTRNRYGVLGRDWVRPPAGTIGVDETQAEYEEILLWGTPQSAYTAIGSPTWFRWGSFKRALSPDPFELEKVLWDAWILYEPYIFRQSVPRDLAFTSEEAREYTELNQLIVEYKDQSLARFVTGDLNIARDWDTYVNNLNSMGLPRLIALTQAGFDRSWKDALGY